MTDTLSIREARTDLGGLVRRAGGGERITITDHGHPTAVLVPADTLQRIEDLEDSLAIAQIEVNRLSGRQSEPIANEEARRRFTEAAQRGRQRRAEGAA